MKTIVDIKQIFYGDPLTSGTLNGAAVKAFITSLTTKQITNVHATTWTYEEQEGNITDYINQLNGQTYYRDAEPGSRSINFTIGQYDYETKADLQGGTATATTWIAPEHQGIIYKCIVAVTKDDTYIAMPKAQINTRSGMVESKLIGMLLAATPLETGVQGLAAEGWFDASEVA